MKPILLEGRAFDLALELKRMNEEHDAAHEALKAEFKMKSNEICTIARNRHNILWSELNDITGTSGSADLGLDTEYAEQGVIFMKEEPKEESMFGGLSGSLAKLLEGISDTELTPEASVSAS